MTFPRAKPGGYTDDVDVLPASELNTIDVNQSRALDGTDGGLYTPSTEIQIAGAGIELQGSLQLKYATRSITRIQPMGVLAVSAGGNFEYDTGAGADAWKPEQTIAGGAMGLQIERIPNGATITSILCRVKGAPGHGASPTATLPVLKLHRYPRDGDFPSVVASVSDPSTTNTQYEAVHDHELSGLSEVVDLELYSYAIRIDGEVGGDFQAGWQMKSWQITCDVSAQTEF
jgi:hypothetical protein